MTTSVLATVTILIVVAAGLVGWISAVFHAERHADPGRGGASRHKITGGIFRGDSRQQMPRRDAPADVVGRDGEPGHGDQGVP